MKTVYTKEAPFPVGPYSQALALGPWLICSGQIPLDPKTSQKVGENVKEQTEQVFKNILAVLKCENLSLNEVVKTTVFLKDMNDFNDFNQVYSSYFKDHKPARSCVEVSRLPKDSLVEIEVWAHSSKQ